MTASGSAAHSFHGSVTSRGKHEVLTQQQQWRVAFRDHAACRTSTRLTLWELAAHSDEDGLGCAPGVAALSGAAGVSPATVKRALEWGRTAGWIVRTGRGARRLAEPDSYALEIPEDPDAVTPLALSGVSATDPAVLRAADIEQFDPSTSATPPVVASMSAAEFKVSVLIPAYGIVAETDLDILRETYWSKLAAES